MLFLSLLLDLALVLVAPAVAVLLEAARTTTLLPLPSNVFAGETQAKPFDGISTDRAVRISEHLVGIPIA